MCTYTNISVFFDNANTVVPFRKSTLFHRNKHIAIIDVDFVISNEVRDLHSERSAQTHQRYSFRQTHTTLSPEAFAASDDRRKASGEVIKKPRHNEHVSSATFPHSKTQSHGSKKSHDNAIHYRNQTMINNDRNSPGT